MTAQIGLQLYSVREPIARYGFETIVRKIAEMEYAGVEPAGFPGATAEAAGALFRELGLIVPSAHIAMPLGDEKQTVLDTMTAIGGEQITSPGIGQEPYKSIDGIIKAAARFNEANTVAQEHGFAFAVHNHWMEFQEVEGRNAHDVLLEHLDKSVLFQPDTYWIQTAGLDPAAILKNLGKRAPTIHVKDGPCTRKDPMVPLGAGSIDIPSLVEAGRNSTEWIIVELDRVGPEVDMIEAVERSASYLIQLLE